VTYAVDANAGAERGGELTIAGRSFVVTQDAAPAGGAADLAIGNVAWPLVRSGRRLTYLIAVVNRGPEAAANVVISDTLPAGTTVVRAPWAPVGCPSDGTSLTCLPPSGGTPCSVSGAVVSCSVGALAPVAPGNWVGAGMLVEVTVTAPPGTTLVNVATVSASTPDPLPGHNANSATTRVLR
jgi:uncharacterized repeat protein (TIGR01451 family)